MDIRVTASNPWGTASAETQTEFDPCPPCSSGDCREGSDSEPAIDIRQGMEEPPAEEGDPEGMAPMTVTPGGRPQTVGRIALRPDEGAHNVEVGLNVTPASLVPHGENPLLHQVGTLTGVTIVEQIPGEQRAVVRFYAHAQMSGPDESGWRDPLPEQEPEHWTSLQRVEEHTLLPAGAAFGYLLCRSVGGHVEFTLYSENHANPAGSPPSLQPPSPRVWNLVRGDAEDWTVLQRIVNTDTWENTTRIERREIREAGGTLRRVTERRRSYMGDLVTLTEDKRIDDPDGDARTTTTFYYTGAAGQEYLRGRARYRVSATGARTDYEYDAQGRLEAEETSWDGMPADMGRRVEYSYTPVVEDDHTGHYGRSPRKTVEKVGGTEVSQTYRGWVAVDSGPYAGTTKGITERAEPGADYGASASLRTDSEISDGVTKGNDTLCTTTSETSSSSTFSPACSTEARPPALPTILRNLENPKSWDSDLHISIRSRGTTTATPSMSSQSSMAWSE